MDIQFFGSMTWKTLVGLATVTLAAIVLRYEPAVAWVILAIFFAATLLYLRNPHVALCVAFAELFSFSHGHLLVGTFSSFPVTVRMAIFFGIMLGWTIRLILKREYPRLPDYLLQPWVLLVGAVFSGFIIGLRENNPASAFDDANGYFFAAYLLPIVSVSWTRERTRDVLQVFFASAIWVALFSLGALYLFTHLEGTTLVPVYKFIRDARIGEITLMEGGYWRVFLQSQIVLLPAIFFLFTFENETKQKSWKTIAASVLLPAALLMGLSRSFWLGGLVGAGVLLLLLKTPLALRLKHVGLFATKALLGAVLLILATVFLVFPLPSRVANLQNVFAERTTEFGDAALSSRWKLLPVMWEAVKERPFIGSGFGKGLTVQSDDPRIRAQYPDGKWTTHAFEWGWLDLWLKMGVIGILAFLWLFAAYASAIARATALPLWIRVSFLSTLAALFVVHAFSPYLNHPLGLGLFLFISPFILHDRTQASRVAAVAPRIPFSIPSSTPATVARSIEV